MSERESHQMRADRRHRSTLSRRGVGTSSMKRQPQYNKSNESVSQKGQASGIRDQYMQLPSLRPAPTRLPLHPATPKSAAAEAATTIEDKGWVVIPRNLASPASASGSATPSLSNATTASGNPEDDAATGGAAEVTEEGAVGDCAPCVPCEGPWAPTPTTLANNSKPLEASLHESLSSLSSLHVNATPTVPSLNNEGIEMETWAYVAAKGPDPDFLGVGAWAE